MAVPPPAWLIWRQLRGPHSLAAGRKLLLFDGPFVLNLAWSAGFFGAQSIAGGLVVIGLCWLAIVATVVAFDRPIVEPRRWSCRLSAGWASRRPSATPWVLN